MRMILAVVMVLSFAVTAFADVTAEIVGKDIDSNGSIVIKTQYKIDGVEVESRYPQEGGKYYWVTRYSKQNFAGMDATQIQARIDKDIQAFGESLILKPFQEEQRQALKTANTAFYNISLTSIVGHKVTVTEAKMIVDTNFDGVQDKEWTVKTDGTKNEKDYTAPAITP